MNTALKKSLAKRESLSLAAGRGAKVAWLAIPWLFASALASVSCARSSPSSSVPRATANSCPNADGKGCGPAGASARAHGGMMEADCPMNVPGTSMHPVDVAGGVALEFSTTSDVTDLRRRVARMAEMHNRGGAGGMTSANMMDGGMMQGQGMMDGGMMGNGMMGNGMMGNGMMGNGMMGGGMMGGGMMGIQADARAEDTPQGARLIFTPRDPANLEALRGQAKANANQGCPMMSMH